MQSAPAGEVLPAGGEHRPVPQLGRRGCGHLEVVGDGVVGVTVGNAPGHEIMVEIEDRSGLTAA